jgi:hypothetical protein
MPARTHHRELLRLDAASQWAVQRFLIKLGVVGVFAGCIVNRPVLASILMLGSVNILVSVMIAVLYRETLGNDASLNHWDEALAFTALCALAHGVRGALGWG